MDLEERVSVLEDVVADLRHRLTSEPQPERPSHIATTGTTARADPGHPTDHHPTDRPGSGTPADGQSLVTEASDGDEALWLLSELEQAELPGGAVAYGGVVDLPTGEHYQWQWERPTETVLDLDWAQIADQLDALGSPVRLRILHAVLNGTRTTAGLGNVPGLGTGGQLHHHLRILTAAGWLSSTARGHWAVPAQRVVPLLTTILATGE